ncbi:MAG: hypothetical protein ACYCO3_04805 [Mycobacteriales bacterium]
MSLQEVSRRAQLLRAAALVRAGRLEIVQAEDLSELRRVRP